MLGVGILDVSNEVVFRECNAGELTDVIVWDWLHLSLSGVNRGDAGIVGRCDEAFVYVFGERDRSGEFMERVDTLHAVGGEGSGVDIPVLPNPPVPREVSDMMFVVVISG